MDDRESRSKAWKIQSAAQIVVAFVAVVTLFQNAGCASMLSQADTAFVARGNQICALGNAEIDKAWKALRSSSGDLTAEEKNRFVENVFIPNVRQQLEKVSNLQVDTSTLSIAAEAEIEAMVTAGNSALVALENDPALLFAEDQAASVFSAMDTAARSAGLDRCTSDPLY